MMLLACNNFQTASRIISAMITKIVVEMYFYTCHKTEYLVNTLLILSNT
jgi:hypothetical protein